MTHGAIQKLAPADYHKCSTIWDMESNPARTQFWHGQLAAGNRITFVYVSEDDRFVGEASLVFEQGDPDYTLPGRRIYFSRLIVAPEWRNRGIGTKLLDHLIGHARGLGYRELSVGVDIANVGARWIYEKAGFDRILFVGEDAAGRYVKLLKQL